MFVFDVVDRQSVVEGEELVVVVDKQAAGVVVDKQVEAESTAEVADGQYKAAAVPQFAIDLQQD